MIITRQNYFKGREKKFAGELTDDMRSDADKIISRTSELLSRYQNATGDFVRRDVTSGWRPLEINKATPGASPTSQHIYCRAIDIRDSNKLLGKWCVENQEVMGEIGLWMESLLITHDSEYPWVHFQVVPPRSGARIFIP